MFKLRISKSVIIYVSIFTILVLTYCLVFQYLMRTYENKQYDFITAIYWVIVSMTTVGYGDIYFNSPVGHLFSIVVALSGVMMIFAMLFPLVVTPWLEQTIRKELPAKVQAAFRDHIIICGYNQIVETLITELDEYGIPLLLLMKMKRTLHS
jgi:voltage-gated potassium channel